MSRVTAVFDDPVQAERAVKDLRAVGANKAYVSFHVSLRHGRAGPVAWPSRSVRARKGALAGAGLGTVLGIVSALVPGSGPLITAAGLASAMGSTGGTLAAGAILGGATGAVAALATPAVIIAKWDGVLVVVETGRTLGVDDVRRVLTQYHARRLSD